MSKDCIIAKKDIERRYAHHHFNQVINRAAIRWEPIIFRRPDGQSDYDVAETWVIYRFCKVQYRANEEVEDEKEAEKSEDDHRDDENVSGEHSN